MSGGAVRDETDGSSRGFEEKRASVGESESSGMMVEV